MNIDPGKDSEKGIPFSPVDAHLMQVIIIEDPVIYPFRTCPVVIDFFVFCRSPGNRRIKPDIPTGFRVDTTAVGRWGARTFAGTGFLFAADNRVAPFTAAASGAEAPVDHAVSSLADGSAIRVNGNVTRNGSWTSPVFIEVNERPDFPFSTKPVSRIIIMCRIQTEVANLKGREQGTKLLEVSKDTDTVMPPCVKKADVQWKIHVVLRIMIGKHIQGVAKIIAAQVTIPTPMSIQIRIMAWTFTMGNAFFRAITYFVPVRVGMGMYAGAVSSQSDSVRRDQPSLYRGDDSSQDKEFLHCFFIMKREIPVRERKAFHEFRNTGVPVRELLPFGKFFERLLILAGREKILPSRFFEFGFMQSKPVDKIIIRPKRRKGIWGEADQKSEQVIVLKFLNPIRHTGLSLIEHKDQGAQDLWLVLSRTPSGRIKGSQKLHNRIQIQKPKFFPGRRKSRGKSTALGRIEMNFCLMQEETIFLLRLPVT